MFITLMRTLFQLIAVLFQVSTYCLFVEDVKEVLSDTVIVREAAVSRIQRLTKVLSSLTL